MFTIEKIPGRPLYLQFYEQIRDMILSGTIKKGQRLPATRKIAEEYHVSRNTVIYAYEQLQLEGYIRPARGSGYYAEAILPFKGFPQPGPSAPANVPESPCPHHDYSFTYGDLDYNCYHFKEWRKCLINAYDRLSLHASACYESAKGSFLLRKALCHFLYLSRGVRCLPEQLIITSGHQESLKMIADLFPSPETLFMEDPGYTGTVEVIRQKGIKVVPVPLEANGISVDALVPAKNSLVYITPSHQFPTGSVLPIAKRYRILALAAKNNLYILEDDYDSELRYHTRPIPSLQSIDTSHRTIYLGTFSKSFSPDLRVAYFVLPPQLVRTWEKKNHFANCPVSTLVQEALADYLESGLYQRQLNAIRTHYGKKHDFIRDYVRKHLKERAFLQGEDAGLHFLLTIRTKASQEQVAKVFAKKHIEILSTKPFWIRKPATWQNQWLLGYSRIPFSRLPAAMDRLAEAIYEVTGDKAHE
jgi:GntR family transcriptional regulator/MocR family aminotransferase